MVEGDFALVVARMALIDSENPHYPSDSNRNKNIDEPKRFLR
jgi:hypothetical protein